MIPQEPNSRQGKTRAEYIAQSEECCLLANHLRAVDYDTNTDFLSDRAAYLQEAQVYATLACAAPKSPSPSPEHAEAVSAIEGVNELLESVNRGLTQILQELTTGYVETAKERAHTLRTLIQSWRGEVGE